VNSFVRFWFWRLAFWWIRKRLGITSYSYTLSPTADRNSYAGRAVLFRDAYRMTKACQTATPFYKTNSNSASS
jgi:hypothetical protein